MSGTGTNVRRAAAARPRLAPLLVARLLVGVVLVWQAFAGVGCLGLFDPDETAGPGVGDEPYDGPAVTCPDGQGASRDGSVCLPRGSCIANAHVEDGACECDHGFDLAPDGSRCERTDCGSRQHVEGDECVCDPLHHPNAAGDACLPDGATVVEGTPLMVSDASLAIRDDANGDGALNPGEAAEIAFDLVNTGGAPLDGELRGTFRAESPVVSWAEAAWKDCDRTPLDVRFGTCAPGEACALGSWSGRDAIHVCVAPDAAPGTVVEFVVEDITADLAHVSPAVRFSLTIQAAGGALAVAPGVRLSDDTNGDGVLNPGEAALVSFDLENTGSATIVGPLAALLRSDSPHVSWSGPRSYVDADRCGREPVPVDFQGCGAGEVCAMGTWSTAPSFVVCLAADTPAGAVVTFALDRIVDAQEQAYPDLQIDLPVYAADAVLAVAAGTEVRDDRNDDGVPNPGDAFDLAFALVNQGTAAVEGPVEALFRSDSPHVTWAPPGRHADDCGADPVTVVFDGCAAGARCGLGSWSHPDHLTICVGPDAPVGTPVTFTIDRIVDGLGQPHPDLALPLPVYAADSALALDGPPAVEDRDGGATLAPGGVARLSFDLRNPGTARVVGPVTGRVRSDGAHATLAAGSWNDDDCAAAPAAVTFDGCPAGEVCRMGPWGSARWFTVCVAPAAPAGQIVAFTLTDLTDDMGRSYPDVPFSLVVR